MTLNTLRTEILTTLCEDTTPRYWTNAEVDSAINLALNTFLAYTGYYVNKVSVSRSGAYFTIPSDIEYIDAIIYGGKPLEIKRAKEMSATGTNAWETTTGTEAKYAVFDMSITPASLPSATISQTFRIFPVLSTYTTADVYYIPYLTMSSGVTVPVPPRALTAVKYYAMAELLKKVDIEEDLNRAKQYTQEFITIATGFTFENFSQKVVLNGAQQ